MGMSAGLPAYGVAERSISFDALTSVGGGLCWVQSGADDEGERFVAWSAGRGETSFPVAIGSSLHAYGGGAYAVENDQLWYVSAGDGQVWRSGIGSPLTHEHRTLGDLSLARQELLTVGENPTHDDLLAIDVSTGEARALQSAPFLSAPRWNAGRLAWVSWDAGQMPWDSSELWVGEYAPREGLTSVLRVAGGQGVSVTEPRWAQGGDLFYMSDETGWWNLYRWSATAGQRAVAPVEADCAAAPWEHGYASYAFLPQGEIAMVAQSGPRHRLVVTDREGHVRELPTPYTSIKPYLAEYEDGIAMIAASPVHPQQIVFVRSDGADLVVVRAAASDPDPTMVSVPQQLSCVSGRVEISISYYPPSGAAEPRATVVRAHSGPTYQSDLRLDWEVQFFTSRGFAIADVDYRGSTGFGRAFRTALNGRWGVADVEDCANAARHLVGLGKAHSGRLIIFGASAGGYTALRSVCDPATPFALAVARSPIVDPLTWRQTAPRFQRAHAAKLASADSVIDPVKVCRPVALVHGGKDPVAPVADARRLVERLRDQGYLAVRFLELADVGHFPSGQALVDAIEFELAACEGVASGSLR
jgi:dipeptidyl aminopeptidase/acylaminoacyl peptidase